MGIFNEEKPKRNEDISCSCKDCTFHDGECWCIAEKIAVGPTNAKCCADTVCATFRKRQK